jgi:hypothetical protein
MMPEGSIKCQENVASAVEACKIIGVSFTTGLFVGRRRDE